jgi:hypothetical protein
MAKRHGALGSKITKSMRHPRKTKKRLAAKKARLAKQHGKKSK